MSSPPPLGFADPPVLTGMLDETVLDRLEFGVAGLGNRQDRAARMASFAAAVALCPPGEPFTLKEIARSVPSAREVTYRQISNLLDGGGWDVDELRRYLVAWGIGAEVQAIVVEISEVPVGPSVCDIVSIHFLGDDWSLPVGWNRITIPGKEGSIEEEINELERRAVNGLFKELGDDLHHLGHPTGIAPVFSFDTRYGESEGVRRDLARHDLESFLEVGPAYAGPANTAHPYEQQVRRPELAESMPFIARGPLPQPRPITGPRGPNSNFITPFVRNGMPTYGIAGPQIAKRPGSLGGHRSRQRARQLGDLASRIVVPDAAQRLRVSELRHQDDAGWIKGATLLSTVQAIALGAFA
jgi:hypothetical protein